MQSRSKAWLVPCSVHHVAAESTPAFQGLCDQQAATPLSPGVQKVLQLQGWTEHSALSFLGLVQSYTAIKTI